MTSGYRSWEERDADVAKTKAETARLAAEAQVAAQAVESGAAATETAKLAEQVKQAKLRKQLGDVTEAAKDDETERKARRREQRDENGTTFKILVNVVMALGLLAALPAQISYFLGLHRKDDRNPGPAWTLGPIPFFLELLAWVGVMGTRWAHRKGLPRWPFWLMTAALASVAGYINLAHGITEYGTVAGIALAATSVIGPLLAEVRQFLETKAAEDGRDLKQRAKDRRAAREAEKAARERSTVERAEDERRKKLFKDEFAEFERIMAAHPTGGISREDAWLQAWDTMHGLPLSVTAESLASKEAAREAIETVWQDYGRSPESVAVDLWLADVFGSNRGDDGPAGTPTEGPSGGPAGGGSRARSAKRSEARTTLAGKGKQPPRRPVDPDTERPLEEADLKTVRTLAEALGGKDRLSARNVREAVGCRTKYAIRLRDAVTAEPEHND
ncbi:hypothetical protein [Streptomyces triticiradicis]|uniref:DUF2637 domain-containing protein n=1 Tax=Streptomyces triticiradicis TaxID=2651189 RepID=A0A7J5D5W6_9ACTN|nr:hypothetical protein [Streptomyces triticiradicis]KAB1979471.1 hypothetical protein F8144_36275 [Streptomyces triticiradicis]